MKNIKRFLLLILAALTLNIIWEFSHYQLYIDLTGISSVLHLILASFADMAIITLIYLLITIKHRSFKWVKYPSKSDYLILVILALIVAIVLEVVNVFYLGRWAYASAMPTIFGIGLSPVLQLPITGSLALWLNNKTSQK